MLLCAAIGLALLVTGAWSLPRPSALVPSSAPAIGAAPARASASPGEPAASSPAAPPTTEPAQAQGVLVADTGPGTYEEAKVSVPSTTDEGRLYRFDVRVEKGLDLDPDAVARALEKTLDDPRSWRSTGRVRFALVAAGETADLHAYVVTPGTTDKLCAPLLTRGEVSCRAGDKVVLNAKRWVLGADAYGTDVAAYREYLVNHEFGHALGHSHVGCPRTGQPSPVMLQQTKGLQGCTANPWPSVTKG
ncbi:DUF3152 domain-containing protein [Microlunatus spumicola]|uniref:DUF3152 domain-containing protein n=1 Tax=Microlunatus spumicola TaxID=81499 RepID=A0ABP6XHM6_9ACTN